MLKCHQICLPLAQEVHARTPPIEYWPGGQGALVSTPVRWNPPPTTWQAGMVPGIAAAVVVANPYSCNWPMNCTLIVFVNINFPPLALPMHIFVNPTGKVMEPDVYEPIQVS